MIGKVRDASDEPTVMKFSLALYENNASPLSRIIALFPPRYAPTLNSGFVPSTSTLLAEVLTVNFALPAISLIERPILELESTRRPPTFAVSIKCAVEAGVGLFIPVFPFSSIVNFSTALE